MPFQLYLRNSKKSNDEGMYYCCRYPYQHITPYKAEPVEARLRCLRLRSGTAAPNLRVNKSTQPQTINFILFVI
ncbi:MAG: hypothetical protein R6V72_17295 [Cyclobacterium sp.]|uniref:hypothetical protein n=1 Tax=Cyclobacterium sp. TaxID=1966343 RepID=UPI0039709821